MREREREKKYAPPSRKNPLSGNDRRVANSGPNLIREAVRELRNQQLITESDLLQVKGKAKRYEDLLTVLVDHGYVTENDILSALIKVQKNFPVKEQKYVIATDLSPEMRVLGYLSADAANRGKVMPYREHPDEQVIEVVFPFSAQNNVVIQDEILSKAPAGYRIRTLVSTDSELKSAITRNYRAEQEIRKINEGARKVDATARDTDGIEEVILAETDSVRFVNMVLDQAISDGASDIHIEQDEDNLKVRFRLDGLLRYFSKDTPISLAPSIIGRIKVMANMDPSESRKPQDGNLSRAHKTGVMDFRASTIPTTHGEKIVMRILDNSATKLTLTQLGFTDYNLARFKRAYTDGSCLILVTGPTGSGKSTTLYATLNAITDETINIMTVEDPVEYKIEGINQIQVNTGAGFTFASALRAILRQDPDVVLIGEIRDAETATTAIQAAQTGHLVLSTLHTNDAPSAYERLIDFNVDKFLAGSVTKSILAQRLCRRLCKFCRVPAVLTPEVLLGLGDFPYEAGDELPEIYDATPAGCKNCNHSGYKGRMGIHEILLRTRELELVISSGGRTGDIRNQAIKDGMLTLRMDGWGRVLNGETSIAEILRVTSGSE